ncbi:MAG: dihydrolipoamide dehydrogenase [Promethearchaeota archaeon CR_4]|nr:MAG: dihydrolipoamide dehydrogenase [Candidatus Lokiarchaeota archaeon CR_4]
MELAQEKGLGLTVGNSTLDFRQIIAHKNELVQTLRDGLIRSFEQQQIEVIRGTAKVVGANEVEVKTAGGAVRKKAKYIVIATGVQYKPLPPIGKDKTIPASSSELLDFQEIPNSLLLIGNDYVTATFASIFADLGSKVTILCPTPRLLPDFEEDVVDGLVEELGMVDVKVMTDVQVVGASRTKVKYKGEKGDKDDKSEKGDKGGKADQILEGSIVANLSDQAGNTDELGLEACGIAVKDGFVTVKNGFETSMPSIYAIGDVTSSPWRLSHKASEEGRILADVLMGNKLSMNYTAIPKIVFSRPMVATVGMTETQLKDRKTTHRVFRFPVARNSFAHVFGEIGGMLKILAAPDTGTILGVSVIGIFATELIAECAIAIKEKMTVEQLARVPQVHPSIAELLKDAMYAFHNQVEKE